MTIVIENNNDIKIDDAPPSLPPFLNPKREPNGRYIILPDITRIETSTKTQANNTWTIHYFWMMRMHSESMFDGPIEIAHVNSRKYRQWLETYESENDIPPHISFGGCVKTCYELGEDPDPEFFDKWVKYAKETFY